MKVYPPKVFSFKEIFLKYFKKISFIIGSLILIFSILSVIDYFLKNIFKFVPIRFFSFISDIPWFNNLLVILFHVISFAVILFIIFTLLLIFGIFFYFIYSIIRKAKSYNLVFEGNNITKLTNIIIPKLRLSKNDSFAIYFSNNIKNFLEVSFTINKLKAYNEERQDIDWRIGIFLLDKDGKDTFCFHAFLKLNKTNNLQLAYYNSKKEEFVNKAGRYIGYNLEQSEFKNYKLELLNKKPNCYINDNLKNHEEEEKLDEEIHLIRFQIWTDKKNAKEFIEANIRDFQIIWI